MKRINFSFTLCLLLVGCAGSNPVLKTDGYYSNGNKFLYCKNPNLFDARIISFINMKYLSNSDKKITTIINTQDVNNDNYTVKSPLHCIGEVILTDGSQRNFQATIDIPRENSPRIESLSFSRNLLKEEADKKAFLKSFNLPAIMYCQDLMERVRSTYGKAPLCVPIIKNSLNITKSSGLIGLSDDQTPSGIYFYMNIIPGQLSGDYSYDENELSTLISILKMQNKGV